MRPPFFAVASASEAPKDAVLTDRSAQEPQRRFAIPLGRQQEVHRGGGFVYGPVEIFPGASDLHIGLIQPPSGAARPLAGTELTVQLGRVFDDPAIERRMVNLDASLFHHLLELLPVADRVGDIPPDAP